MRSYSLTSAGVLLVQRTCRTEIPKIPVSGFPYYFCVRACLLTRMEETTFAPVTVPTPGPFKPEFIRLPKPGTTCPWTGLARSAMNELVLPTKANSGKPPVKSKVLRKKGATTGIRLIVFESLMEYLHAAPDGDTLPESAESGTASSNPQRESGQ